jgi:hypothetical protein
MMTVRVSIDGKPAEGLWVSVSLRMARKNDFRSAHGPSDALGHVAISGFDVRRRAQHDRDMFPMDYGAIDADWTGGIELRVMNRDAIGLAVEAVETWGAQAWASPQEVRRGLAEADAVLATREGAALTVELVATPADPTIVPITTQA